MGRKSDYENYWGLFWQTGMPEAFGVYRMSKDIAQRKADENGVVIPDDPPMGGEPL